MLDIGQLRVCIIDNENTNDTIVRLVLTKLEASTNIKLYQVRYLGHIINLTTQAH